MSGSVLLFQFVGESIDGAVQAFMLPAVSSVADVIGPTALGGTTLYLLCMGYMTMGGYIASPISAIVKQVIKLSVVSAFALNSENYLQWVVGALEGLQVGLADAVMPGANSHGSVYATLDGSLDRAFTAVGTCLENANSAGMNIAAALGWLFCGISVGMGALLFTVAGGAIVVTAKLALGIMFGIGPLFVMCLMWSATAKFFDAWLAQVLNYTFTIVLSSVVLTFASALFDHFIAGADFSSNGINSPAFAALQVCGLCGLLLYVLYQVNGMASGLAGGVSIAALSLRELASPVSGAARFSSTSAASLNDIANPVSNRLDPNTGLQTTSRRLEHLAMGRSMLSPNPAYRRAVMDQFRQAIGSRNSVSAGKDGGTNT